MIRRKTIAITMGDPAGIGPEVCLKSLERSKELDGSFVVVGDADVLQRLGRLCGLPTPPVATSLPQAIHVAHAHRSAVLHVDSLGPEWLPRRVTDRTGRASFDYIQMAIDGASTGQFDAVVTGPIHKDALRQAGIPFPGHTEIFEALTGAERACMLLTSEALTCSFVTTHVGLDEVSRLITTRRVLDVIELTQAALRAITLRAPRLAVCGLNPHAGENGLFGNREEERLIAPAIELARQRGISIVGPLPPDTAFLSSKRKLIDAYICMYHDQGHIPLKALSFETAVNVTLGLPIIRTSVDHGTALDIAWQDYNADPTSLRRAMELALKLCTASTNATSIDSQSQEVTI